MLDTYTDFHMREQQVLQIAYASVEEALRVDKILCHEGSHASVRVCLWRLLGSCFRVLTGVHREPDVLASWGQCV